MPPKRIDEDVKPLSETAKVRGSERGFSARALLLAFACIVGFSLLTPYNDYYIANTFIAGNLLPTSSIVVLLMLVMVINPLLWRYVRRFAFRAHELATVWALIVIASGIPAAGLWRYIIPQIANLLYRASPENRWMEILVPYTPAWLIVSDKVVVRQFFRRHPWKPDTLERVARTTRLLATI